MFARFWEFGRISNTAGSTLLSAPSRFDRAAQYRDKVTSNRVRGEWTGVSLARYRGLVAGVASCPPYALPLFLRVVWEKAAGPDCLVALCAPNNPIKSPVNVREPQLMCDRS